MKTGAESAEFLKVSDAVEEAAEQSFKIGADTLELAKNSFEFSGKSKIPVSEIKEVLGNTDVFKQMPRGAPEFGGFKQGIDGDQIREINRAFGGITELSGVIETGLANAANYTGFYNKSAAVIEKIAAGHLFDNGNKRTAIAVFEILQLRNGVFTPLSHDQVVTVIEKVAKGDIVGVENIGKALQGL
jgi:death-on-curing family protein